MDVDVDVGNVERAEMPIKVKLAQRPVAQLLHMAIDALAGTVKLPESVRYGTVRYAKLWRTVSLDYSKLESLIEPS